MPIKNKIILKSLLTEKSELMVARFGFEDSLMAAGYSDGQVRVFNLNTDNKISQITTSQSEKHVTPVNCLRWRPASEDLGSISSVLLVANTNGRIIQYVAKTGKQMYQATEEDNLIMALDYAPDGRKFCTAGKDNLPRIYDEETKEICGKLKGVKWHTHGHNNRIFSVKFKPDDPNILASGGWDQNVNIWDIREGTSIATIYGPKIAGDAVDMRDHLILTGANRGKDQLELWDWRNNQIAKAFKWDKDNDQTNAFLFSAQFCHNTKDTVLAAGANQMKIFNLEDGAEQIEVRTEEGSSLYTCDSGYTSNRYLCGGNTGSAYYMAAVRSYE